MDPCRRIFGTYRDYVPNIGLEDSYATEYGGKVLSADRTHYLGNNTNGTNTWLALTDNAANGTVFAYKGYSNYATDEATHAAKAYVTSANWTCFNKYLTTSKLTTAAGAANKNGMMGVSEMDGFNTGLPKPQYVPVKTPWVYGQRFTSNLVPGTTSAYCEETENCFGTYLLASTPQVRRTTTTSNAYIAALDANNIGSSNTPNVKIQIQNLMYVGQQIILPDEVTANIVRMAVNGDISLLSHSCKTYRTTLNSSSTQNLILPIKIASANALFVLFQNTTMLENTNYASCTRNCPFTSFQWTDNGYTSLIPGKSLPYFVGSDLPPVLKSINTTNPFSIQLRLGNELLPIQPITNLHMLTQELQRAVHAANDMMWSVPTISTFRNFRSATADKPKSSYASSLTSGGN